MHNSNPEELSRLTQLSPEVINELTIRAIGEADLSEIEQLIFSLRHRLTRDDAGTGLMGLEEVTSEIYRDSGEQISPDMAMSVLERAEAKVSRFAWETLEKAARQLLGMDHAG